jgi:hypothetical protein
VIFTGRAIEAEFTDSAVVEKLSISMIAKDVFASAFATIETFERFLEVPPDGLRSSTYPPAAKSAAEIENSPPSASSSSLGSVVETAMQSPTPTGLTMLQRFPATLAGNVQFLEWVFIEVREQAVALREIRYPYSSIERQLRDGVKWAEARERLALLQGLPENVVKRATGILRRELNAGTVEHITELLEPAVRAIRNAFENSDLGPTESLQQVMSPQTVDLSLTAGFRDQLHDDLLVRLLKQLEIKPLGNPRLSILQSLQDHGCDLLAEWPEVKYGAQLKNNGDVEGIDFATKTIAQIQDSRQHGLEGLFLVLAADITGVSNQQKVRILMSRISAMNDPYVIVIPPERAWPLIFPASP